MICKEKIKKFLLILFTALQLCSSAVMIISLDTQFLLSAQFNQETDNQSSCLTVKIQECVFFKHITREVKVFLELLLLHAFQFDALNYQFSVPGLKCLLVRFGVFGCGFFLTMDKL